jgi:hypothetical protein
MSVAKQDAGENARSFQLDREAWVLLVAFPEDLKNSAMIAKPVSGFGIMVDWHEMENVARVVVKVYLNDDAKIPDSIKVNAGVPQTGRSWTVPCYVLKRQSVQELMDEDAFITVGPLHPTPPQAPRWMGPADPAGSGTTPRGSNSAGNMQVDDGDRGRWQQKSAPIEADPDRTISEDLELNPNLTNNPVSKLPDVATATPNLKSVIVGPSHEREPLWGYKPLYPYG